MPNTFIQDIRDKAAKRFLKVAFPDAEDVRTLKAALTLRKDKIAEPWLVGPAAAIRKIAADNGLDLGAIPVIDPQTDAAKSDLINLLFEKRKAKGWTIEQSAEAAKSPLYYAGLLLATGKVGAVVGGNISSTGDVIRAAIHTVGTAPGISTVSSYFIMVFPEKAPLLRRLRRRSQSDRRPAGRHRHHLGQELPGRDRRGAARGHAVVLDQGLGRPRRRRQGRDRHEDRQGEGPAPAPRRRDAGRRRARRLRSASASARAARSRARPTSSSSPISTPATSATS